MKTAVVMLHGFSGSPQNLTPIKKSLEHSFPAYRLVLPAVAGGWQEDLDSFGSRLDIDACLVQFVEIIKECHSNKEKIVLLGHSTGGNLLIHFLQQGLVSPQLLVLVGTPWKITSADLKRWEKHSPKARRISLSAIASLVSFVNHTSSIRLAPIRFPALLINGKADELVPAATVFELQDRVFSGLARALLIPELKHHFTIGTRGTNFFLTVLRSTINDVQACGSHEIQHKITSLVECEPELKAFVDSSPTSKRHLISSPSGQEVFKKQVSLHPEVDTEPVFANIEITTKCNLNCVYCARKFIKPPEQEMTRMQFNQILDALPHAYRVTIVGLGEPSLHPGLADFIYDIERRNRRSGIVTNALKINQNQSLELLQAGLQSIAFSLDAPNQKVLDRLRPGSNLVQIVNNIKEFIQTARQRKANISSAVFSALSQYSSNDLSNLAELISSLGVHIWMITDLNYRQNISASLVSSDRKTVSEKISRAITTAYRHGLPVLSVRALEKFGLRKRYRKFLLFSPESIFHRSATHRWCHSPWQTIPISVNGDVTICDCQPDRVVGNLFQQPLAEIWNGEIMKNFRRKMTSVTPPDACLICPRF